MKFLHAADLHLGSALPGFGTRRTPGDVPEDVDAPLAAFENMLELARREDVAFVVIAGDLYDGEWKDFALGLQVTARLRTLGRPCFILRGNHDALSIIPSRLRLPDNVREFGGERCETVALPALDVALHGHSFPERAVPHDLSGAYCPPSPGMLNIGVLHTSAEGAEGHDTYAPCSIGALAGRGYDYWALGHIHARRELRREPWIVFPGNTQGRHVRETGAKGCTIVTVEDRRVVAAKHHDLDVVRWARIEVDVTAAHLHDIATRLEAALEPHLRDAGAGRALAARIDLVGETSHDAQLRDRAEALLADALNAAQNLGGQLWVERLAVRTTPPGTVTARADLEPLRRLFLGALPEVEHDLLDELRQLRAALPAQFREAADLPADLDALRRRAGEAWEMVALRLGAEDAP